MRPTVIGLRGYKRSGKNTTAEIIDELAPNVQAASFAARVRDCAAIMFDLPRASFDIDAIKDDIVPEWGCSRRHMLRVVGMAGRSVHPDTWVRPVLKRIASNPGALWVVTDARFENEVNHLWTIDGAEVWVVDRGLESDGDASEPDQFVPEPDRVIPNKGSVGDLRAAVYSALVEARRG